MPEKRNAWPLTLHPQTPQGRPVAFHLAAALVTSMMGNWNALAKESVPILDEFRTAGFRDVRLLRTIRNARTTNPLVLAAEIMARR